MKIGQIGHFQLLSWPEKQSSVTNFKGLFSVYLRAQSREMGGHGNYLRMQSHTNSR